MRTKRMLVGASIVLGTVLVAAPALAISASLTPDHQDLGPLGTGHWQASWGGGAPYTVTFYYGDGASTTLTNTSLTSKSYSYTFDYCPAGTYTQHLHVKDAAGATADLYVTTHVQASQIC
jgi:hypothetical protein